MVDLHICADNQLVLRFQLVREVRLKEKKRFEKGVKIFGNTMLAHNLKLIAHTPHLQISAAGGDFEHSLIAENGRN